MKHSPCYSPQMKSNKESVEILKTIIFYLISTFNFYFFSPLEKTFIFFLIFISWRLITLQYLHLYLHYFPRNLFAF